MPRMYMAIAQEDRHPITEIMSQTPPIPDNCQWAIFLRNHDELTLEMVTDDERDYLYRVYAHDRQMRINLGIRRRLAPLLGNDRRKTELMNAILFSMPGTPVLYYAALDLSRFRGMTPMELFGRADFPAISDQPWTITIGAHGFFWFALENRAALQEGITVAGSGQQAPLLEAASFSQVEETLSTM